MRLIFLVFLCTFIFAAISPKTDDSIPDRDKPVYQGVDPKAVPIVDEYRLLAGKKNIKFTHTVTVGFTDINHGRVVGVCYYGDGWREIDVDNRYWNNSSDITRRTLLFHELTHCYCSRKHDWGAGKDYPEAKKLDYVKKDEPFHFFVADGFFADGCPLSIMYPYVLTDDCMVDHQEYYENEMFDRCDPF
jgi:hypothetical protein